MGARFGHRRWTANLRAPMTTVDPARISELLLVRHAESEWNATGRWQGHADPPLSPAGRAQARALAEAIAPLLEARRPSLLVCSDLSRAIETARALGAACGLDPVPDPRLRELDVGSWSGLTEPEIRRSEAEAGARIVIVTHLGFIRALQPGVEPDNTGWHLVSASDALARRTRD